MTDETARRIDCTLIALAALQRPRRKGTLVIPPVIPPRTPISPALMAWVSQLIEEPVSKATFRRIHDLAEEKARQNAPTVMARLALKAHMASSLKTEN